MCGIFGFVSIDTVLSKKEYKKVVDRLFLLSETRGKEASGFCMIDSNTITVLKAATRARNFIRNENYVSMFEGNFPLLEQGRVAAIGHARMVTNGDASNVKNNQPVVNTEMVCIHNGIIVNAEKLWKEHSELQRTSEVDTEILLELVKKHYDGVLSTAFANAIEEIEGSVSVALTTKKEDCLLLYTNTGSLYIAYSNNGKSILFASEKFILQQVIKETGNSDYFDSQKIKQLQTNNIYTLDLSNMKLEEVNKYEKPQNKKSVDKIIREVKVDMPVRQYTSHYVPVEVSEISSIMKVNVEKIRKMRRCTKCLLPETFPGIRFDEKGVCTICAQYKKKETLGKEKLLDILESKKTKNSDYDCIIPISGGRDSCYCLHYATKELGLRPVAYTYDWGMVTDLARRNIQRMCSQLQVEHVLVSADIGRKRNYVRMNVEAWLRRPNIATVPLFMAGDKQFFYYAQMLKKQMQVDNIIFGMNSLEETDFKVGFTGISDKSKDNIHYNLSNKNKLGLLLYYAKEFIQNPAFINRSLIDSFTGFMSYYLLPKDYLHFFDYIKWEESVVENTLLGKYNWEKAPDIKGTWRIGDGTAPFYNYIYYRICGFSEYDTFRSNQIREGMISREEAMQHIYEENEPRVEAFVEYCKMIGLDAVEAVRRINQQETLYDDKE